MTMEKRWTLFVAIFLIATSGLAQSFQEKQLAKLAALRHMDNYAFKMDLSNDREYKDMLQMFTDDAQHVNDVLPMNQLFFEELSIQSYREALNNFVASKPQEFDLELQVFGITYKSSSVITTMDEDGNQVSKTVYKLEVLAIKHIRCTDQFGLSYQESIPMVFQLEVQEEVDYEGLSYMDAKISEVRLANKKETFWYITIRKSDLGNFSFKCVNEVLIDENELYLLYKSIDNEMLFENDKDNTDDVWLRAEQLELSNLRTELSKVESKKRRWSAELHANGMFDIDSKSMVDDLEVNLSHTAGYGFGLGLNYHFKIGTQLHGAFRLGVDYFQRSSELQLAAYQWNRDATDPDGFDYQRQTVFSNFTEKLDMQFLLPYLGFKFGKRFGDSNDREIGIDCIANYGFQLGNNFSNTAQLSHQGYYPGLFGITIDDSNIYDFGEYEGAGSGEYRAMESFIRIQAGPYLEQRVMKGVRLRIKTSLAFEWMAFGTSETPNVWVEGTQELKSIEGKIDAFQSLYFLPEIGLIFKKERDTINCK